MGIIDKVGALLPRRSERREKPVRSDVLALRNDLDRWFDRFFEERWELPSVDMEEDDDEVVIRMDVPWARPRGSQPLPPGLDLDGAEARVRRGVLTVRFPKVAAHPRSRRVPIKT